MVYYIGQREGEFYDLAADPDELENLWDAPEAKDRKGALKEELLEWLAASTYWNSGYKRNAGPEMRWPSAEDRDLHGGRHRPGRRPMPYL
jgi:hypothetical protein